MSLANARIDQFDLSAGLTPGGFIAFRNQVTGVTEKVPIEWITSAASSNNFEWLPATPYLTDDVVTRAGLWYQALAGNTDVVPGTDPLTWNPIPKSSSGFVFWVAGAFTEDEVLILRTVDNYVQLFRLANATRPFVSADFELEWAGGDWELMSERGYLAINKAAHGFILNNVLEYSGGAWNVYSSGMSQRAIVRQVIDVDNVIVLIIGNVIKGLTGLTAGQVYYCQNDGTIGTTIEGDPIYIAISTTSAILF